MALKKFFEFHQSRLSNKISILQASILFVYLTFAMISLGYLYANWGYDDPYITYRYAENLAKGLGFVYNADQQVLSTTTPLFAGILALGSLLGMKPHLLAIGMGVISIAWGAVSFWDLGRIWKMPWVSWTGVLLYPTYLLVLATLSSETPLYLALCLGAFVLLARNRVSLAALLAVLATLTRPDGLLVLSIVGIFHLWHVFQTSIRSHPGLSVVKTISVLVARSWQPGLIVFGILGAWVVFSGWYFGSLIPVTLYAKQQQASIIGSQLFAPGLLTIINWFMKPWYYRIEALIALIGLCAFVANWVFTRIGKATIPQFAGIRPVSGLLPLWAGLYFLAYSFLGVTRYYWYYAPLIPGFVMLVAWGLESIACLLQKMRLSWGVWLLFIMLLGLHWYTLFQGGMRTDPRSEVYCQVGQWLQQNTPEDATVGMLEVGIMGYYAQRSVVDFAGLLQPEVAAQMGEGMSYQDTALWAISHYHPNYVVSYREALPALESYLQQICQLVQVFEDANYSVDIYRCD